MKTSTITIPVDAGLTFNLPHDTNVQDFVYDLKQGNIAVEETSDAEDVEKQWIVYDTETGDTILEIKRPDLNFSRQKDPSTWEDWEPFWMEDDGNSL